MNMNKKPIIHKTLFSDKQIEMILDKLTIIFDALPMIIVFGIPAIVVIVAIIYGRI